MAHLDDCLQLEVLKAMQPMGYFTHGLCLGLPLAIPISNLGIHGCLRTQGAEGYKLRDM